MWNLHYFVKIITAYCKNTVTGLHPNVSKKLFPAWSIPCELTNIKSSWKGSNTALGRTAIRRKLISQPLLMSFFFFFFHSLLTVSSARYILSVKKRWYLCWLLLGEMWISRCAFSWLFLTWLHLRLTVFCISHSAAVCEKHSCFSVFSLAVTCFCILSIIFLVSSA